MGFHAQQNPPGEDFAAFLLREVGKKKDFLEVEKNSSVWVAT